MSKPKEELKGLIRIGEFKAGEEANTAIGSAACIGNMDRGGDVIFPGAFKDCLKGFLKAGFIARGHDWGGDPIGYPTSAKESGRSLDCGWAYHSTQDAQDARVTAMERQAAGLDVGLSIGFMIDYPEGCAYFQSGADLLKFAKDNGHDMSLFDVKGIKAWTGPCRAILSIAELFEFSQVTVPMNPLAVATSVKSGAGSTDSDPSDEDDAEEAAQAAKARAKALRSQSDFLLAIN